MTVRHAFAITDNSLMCQIDDDTTVIITGLEYYGSARGVLGQLAEKNFFKFENKPAAIIKAGLPFSENGMAHRHARVFLSKYDNSVKDQDWKHIDLLTDY